MAAGDLDGARELADMGLARQTGSPVLDMVRLPALRGWIAFIDGDLVAAERGAAAAIRWADESGIGDQEPGRVYAELTLAAVHVERMEYERAAEAVAAARRSGDALGRPPLQHLVALVQAAHARAEGDATAAAAHLATARVHQPAGSPTLLGRLALEAARQELRFQPWAAGPAIAALGDDAAARAVRAAHCLEVGDDVGARTAVAALPDPVTAREHVEWGVLRALVARTPGEAEAHLGAALVVAEREGFVQSVVALGPPVFKLLEAHPAGADTAYVADLIERAAAVVSPVVSDAMARLVDPLTPSELNVLRHLSSRLTNREIAAALYVSLNTLKTHIKSVYRKLGVTSRTEAVDAGRRAHLI